AVGGAEELGLPFVFGLSRLNAIRQFEDLAAADFQLLAILAARRKLGFNFGDQLAPDLVGLLGAVGAAGRQDDLDASFAAGRADGDVVKIVRIDAAFERLSQNIDVAHGIELVLGVEALAQI